MPGAAGRLTGGRRRQAGTPRGSSTHARSHPGPRRSRSTPCSEHPVQPQHPGARSWRGGQREDGVTREPARAHPRALCPRILTASPRRSSPPHSTPSQSGRGTCCRAGGCLCGMPAPKSAWKEGKRNLDWASLVAQWLRIRLPMQGTWVRSLLREDPTCRGATKLVCHNY